MAEATVAVLIDYENVGLDFIQPLLDQLSDVGRIIIKRAYADWSVHRGKRDQLLEMGIEAAHHFRSAKSGKNSSDISLAIDAVDLLHADHVDSFVIVSSDSDFVPLVSKLRAAGKSVIGAGRVDITPATLVKSCDRYIYLDEARSAPAKKKRKREPPRSREAEVGSLLARAVEASMDDQGQVVGSKLFQTMLRIDPSFGFKALGHRTFTHFLSSQKEVTVTRPRDVSDVIVQLVGPREDETKGPELLRFSPSEGPEPPRLSPSEGPEPLRLSPSWDREIDTAWSSRRRPRLSGQAAAADAARVLGVPRLRASRYPTLDNLLAASDFLRTRWRRDGNAIVKL